MFNVKFLNTLRAHEIEFYLPYLEKGKKILELGGGTGEQAKQLVDRGYLVESVDQENSTYSEERVFPVKDYDGRHLPFADNAFDIIFSSNVLEHIPDLEEFHTELKRVLKDDGYCVHIMPTGTWRFWTSIAHYVELMQRLFQTLGRLLTGNTGTRQFRSALIWYSRESLGLVRDYRLPPRHGEEGNAWGEIYGFSGHRWKQHFSRNGYKLLAFKPLGLFYTGHMVFGAKLSMAVRSKIASLFGSACNLYKVAPLK